MAQDDREPPSAVPDEIYENGAGPKRGLSRRALVAGAAVAGVATVSYFWFDGMGNPKRPAFVTPTEAGEPGQSLSDTQRATLAAIQDRLLPSAPGSPGARDTNTIGYLDALLATDFIRKYSKQLVIWGANMFQALAQREHEQDFAALSEATQDTLLRREEKFEDTVRFIRKLLSFTLEGFFGDPVHGSNTNGAAWKWIGHQPGHPSPRPDQLGWAPEGR